MAPHAAALSLVSSTLITFQQSASAVAPHHRFASSQAALLSSYEALASSRLAGASSTSGRTALIGGTRGFKIATPVCQAALFEFLKRNRKDKELVKGELLLDIARVDRGAEATAEDQQRIEKIVKELEALNPTKEPLNSSLINGKWMLVYTTSESILKKNRQRFLRPSGPIYQAINTETLRAQNLETWPFFNQVTANLTPVSPKKVIVNFDYFKIGGLLAARRNSYSRSCSKNKDFSEIGAGRGIAEGAGSESDLKSGSDFRSKDGNWCGLCGTRSGWIKCGKCMGRGSFATRPGLAGVKATVGWACCKACYGKTVVPCILCGVYDVQEWECWQQVMRRGSPKEPVD